VTDAEVHSVMPKRANAHATKTFKATIVRHAARTCGDLAIVPVVTIANVTP